MRTHRLEKILILIPLFLSPVAFGQSIFTVAGGRSSEGIPATRATLNSPSKVAVDVSGNLFISDSGDNRVWRVDALSGIITAYAGSGRSGFGGDGGPATEASLWEPRGIALDSHGNLYVADWQNGRIRRVDAGTGVISTYAGDGSYRSSGDGGPAIEASFLAVSSVAIGPDDDVYIVDRNGHVVRRVDAETGLISTVAGSGIDGFSGDGGPATEASLSNPEDVWVDAEENVYIADELNDRIRRVDRATGLISTVAGNGETCCHENGVPATQSSLFSPSGVTIAADGSLYVAEQNGNRIHRVDQETGTISTIAGDGESGFSGDGGPATEARLSFPMDLAFDGSGNLFVADWLNDRVRRVAGSTGVIETVAGSDFVGDGRPGTQAVLRTPVDVALDARGNLYIVDRFAHRIRRIDLVTGRISTYVGNGENGYGGDGGPATEASLSLPEGLAVDAEGNLYIADRMIRRVDAATGEITTVAGGNSGGFRGDGGPATLATLYDPGGLAFDADGNLFITDSLNHRIRRVDGVTGVITTVAGNGIDQFAGDGGPATSASLRFPSDVAVDEAGNLYIADKFNYRVRRVDATTRTITTVAGNGEQFIGGPDGGPATEALLGPAYGVELDGEGSLYITASNLVRRVDLETGLIHGVAGKAPGFAGDGGWAFIAWLQSPSGLALSSGGDLYIADMFNDRVRVIYSCEELSECELSSPSDGSSGVPTTPGLDWEPVEGAFRYDVYVDTSSPPELLAATGVETTSVTIANLAPVTTYYWRVVAKGDPYCRPFSTAASEVRSFTTTNSCEVPTGLETSGP